MARTVDQVAHALRRDEFLDVAQRLLETKGYEQVSIQDVRARSARPKAPSITTSAPSRRFWKRSCSAWPRRLPQP